jgi:hypothetical protein
VFRMPRGSLRVGRLRKARAIPGVLWAPMASLSHKTLSQCIQTEPEAGEREEATRSLKLQEEFDIFKCIICRR